MNAKQRIGNNLTDPKAALSKFAKLFLAKNQSRRIHRVLENKDWQAKIDTLVSNGLGFEVIEGVTTIQKSSDCDQVLEQFQDIDKCSLGFGFGLVDWGKTRRINIENYLRMYGGRLLGILILSNRGMAAYYEGVDFNERYFLKYHLMNRRFDKRANQK